MNRKISILESVSRVGLALLSLFFGMPPDLYAAPTGAQVIHGQVQFQQQGAHTTIHASNRSIINYSGFDIAAHESVQFVQPNAQAWALNRVLSAAPTQIQGSLLANGRIVLVNPAGVYFSSSAMVNVNQLVASGMNITDSSFLSNQWSFQGGDGAVVNEGMIQAEQMFLIGRKVTNTGSLISKDGLVVLAAGESALIRDPGGQVYVEVDGKSLDELRQAASIASKTNQPPTNSDAGIENSGNIEAGAGRIIFAAGDAISQAFTNTGSVVASVETGKAGAIQVAIASGKATNTGTMEANSPDQAGRIEMAAPEIDQEGTLSATGSAGQILLTAGNEENTLIHSGLIDVSGTSPRQVGGTVHLLGDRVGLFGDAVVNASGDAGGGVVLIGGDFQGKGEVKNASRTVVGPQATITANALTNGDGGKVIIWSNEMTRYHGYISAKGGVQSGNGGFAEVSGKEFLDFNGLANLSASNGENGNLLLDPKNLTVDNDAANNPLADLTSTTNDDGSASRFSFSENGDAADTFITVAAVTDQLNAGTSVTLQANDDITIEDSIVGTGANAGLTLQAGDDVILNASITTNDGAINVFANAGGTPQTHDGTSDIFGTTTSGSIVNSASLTAGNASITLSAEGNIRFSTLTTTSNTVSVTTTGGDISGNLISAQTTSLSATLGTVGSATSVVALVGTTSLTVNSGESINVTTTATLTALDVTVDTLTGDNTYTITDSGNLTFDVKDFGTSFDVDNVNVATGNLALTLSTERGDMRVQNIDVGDGNVALNTLAFPSAGDILDNLSDIKARNLTMNASGTGKSIGKPGQGNEINVTLKGTLTANASTGLGGIFIRELSTGGEMTLGTINAGFGNVELTSSVGNIVDGGGSITAANLILTTDTSNTAIGTSANNIDIALTGTLTAQTPRGTGGIFITSTNDLTVTSVDAGDGNVVLNVTGFIRDTLGDDEITDLKAAQFTIANTTGVGITATDALNLDVDQLVLTTSSGNVFITETKDINLGVVNVGTNTFDLKAITGNIQRNASDAITANTLNLTVSGTNTTIGTSTTPIQVGTAGAVTLTANASNGSGGVFVNMTDNAGTLSIASINGGTGEVVLRAATGGTGTINESVNNTNANITTTGTVTLAAPSGIGNTSALDLASVTDLVLDTNNTFNIVNSGGTLTSLNMTVDPAAGTYTLASPGITTFTAAPNGGNLNITNITSAASLALTITTDTGNIQLANDAVNTMGGNVSLASSGSILETTAGDTNHITTTGTVTLIGPGGIGAAGGGNSIDLTNVTGLTVDTNNTFNVVNSGGTLTSLNMTVDPAAGTYTLASPGITTFTAAPNGGNLDITNITSAANLALTVTADTGNIRLANGAINIVGGNVSLTSPGSIIETAAGDTNHITTTSTVTLVGPSGIGTAGGGNSIDLTNVTGLTLDTNNTFNVVNSVGTLTSLNMTVDPAAGTYTLASPGITTFTVAPNGGNLDITNITSAANLALTITADTGNIRLANGAINTVGGNVSITSPGSIIETAAGDTNHITTTGTATLIGPGSIGSSGTGNSIDLTNVTGLTLDTNNTFNVVNSGGTLTSLNVTVDPAAGGSSYTLTSPGITTFTVAPNGGTLDVRNVTGILQDFSLTSDTGNMNIATLNMGAGSISLTSTTGSILSNAAEITAAGAITLIGPGGIGTSGASINLINATTLELNTSNSFHVTNTGTLTSLTLTVNPTTAADSSYQLISGGGFGFDVTDSGSNVIINQVDSGDGNLTFALTSSAGNDIQLANNAISANGGNVTLTSSGSIVGKTLGATNQITTTGTVKLVAPGGIGTTRTSIDLVNTTSLTLDTNGTFNIANSGILGNLTLTVNPSGTSTYALTSTGLTFGMTDNGSNIDLARIISGTALNLTLTSDTGNINIGDTLTAGDSISVGSGNVILTATAGNINESNNNTSTNITTTGTITLVAPNGIGNTSALDLASATGLKLDTDGSFNAINSGTLGSLDITANPGGTNTYALTSTGLTFNMIDNGSNIDVNNVTGTNLGFSLTTDAGNINISTLNTGAGDVKLTATAGSILNIDSSITATGAITLSGPGGIGTAAAPVVLVNATGLTIDTNNSFNVRNTGTLTSLTLAVDPAGASTYGLTSTGLTLGMTDNGANIDLAGVVSGTALNFTLTSDTGNINIGDTGTAGDSISVISGNVSLTATAGNINETNINASTNITTTGTVTLVAPNGIGNTSALDLASATGLTLDTNSSFNVINSGTLGSLTLTVDPAGASTYTLTSAGLNFGMTDNGANIDLARVVSGTALNFTLTSDTGSINIGDTGTAGDSISVDAGNVSLTATAGNINEINNNASTNITTTGSVTLVAPNGIGNTSALDLANATGLILDTNGSFNVANSGTLTSLTATLNPTTATESTYQLTSGGGFGFNVTDSANNIIITQVNSGGGNLNFTLTSSAGGDIQLANGAITVSGGNVSLTTPGSILETTLVDASHITTTGAVTLIGPGGIGTAVVDTSIDLVNTTGLTLDTNNTFNIVNTGTLINLNLTLDPATGGTYTLTSPGVTTFTLTPNSGNLDITDITGTNLNFSLATDTGNINVATLNTGTSNVSLTSTTGSISSNTSAITATGTVTLVGPGRIGATGASINLLTATGLVLNTNNSFDVTNTGTLTNLTVTLNPTTAADSTYQLTSGGGFGFNVTETGNNVLVTQVNSGGGNLNFTLTSSAGGNIQLANGAINTVGGNVSLTSTGSILETAAGDTNHITTTGAVTLVGPGSIGAAGDGNSIDLVNATGLTLDTNNTFNIVNTGGTGLTNLNMTVDPAAAGSTYTLASTGITTFSISPNAGNLDVTNVTGTNLNFTLTAETGNITVNVISTGTSNISLTSTAGSVLSNTPLITTTGAVTLVGPGGIGAAGAENSINLTTVTGLTLDTNNTFNILNTGGTGLTSLNVTVDPSAGTYTLTSPGITTFTVAPNGGNLDITNITSAANLALTVSTDTGNIQLANNAINTIGGNVSLTSTGSILEAAAGNTNHITTTGTVTLIGPGGIGAAGGGNSIDLTNATGLTLDTNNTFNIVNSGGTLTSLNMTVNPAAGTYTLASPGITTFTVAPNGGNLDITNITSAANLALTITADTGNIQLANNAINTVGGNVSLTSIGSITETGASHITTTGAVTLVGPGGIGAVGSSIELANATALTLNTNNSFNLTNTGTLTSLTTTVNPTTATTSTYQLTSGGGFNFNVTESGNNLLVTQVNSGGGNLNFTLTSSADENLRLTTGSIDVGVGNVSITSTGNIVETASGDTNPIIAGNLILQANGSNGTIGSVGANNQLNVTLSGTITANANNGNGAIFITETAGNIQIASINADSGNVVLRTNGATGTINESVNDTTEKIISTGAITLVAPGGIGTTSAVDFGNADDLTLDTDGSFNLTNTGRFRFLNLTINPGTANSTYALSDNTNLTFTSTVTSNNLNLTNLSVTTGILDLTLTTDTGSINVGTVNTRAGDTTLTSTAGSFVNSTSSVTARNIVLNANAAGQAIGVSGTPINVTSNGGALRVSASSGSGGIFIAATGNLIAAAVNADTGNVELSATDDLNLDIDTGSFVSNAGNLTLTAGDDVIIDDTNPGTTPDPLNLNNGNLTITVGPINTTTNQPTLIPIFPDFSAHEVVISTNINTQGGDITAISPSTTIAGTFRSPGFTLSTGGATGGGNMTLTFIAAIGSKGLLGDVNTGSLLNDNGGNITANFSGDLTVGDIETSGRVTRGNATLNSGEDITFNGTVVAKNITTRSGLSTTIANANGGIAFDATGTMTLTTVDESLTMSVNDTLRSIGAMTLSSSGGSAILGQLSTLSGNADVTLSFTGDGASISLGQVTTGTGDLDITAGESLTLNGDITTDFMKVLAGGFILVNAPITTVVGNHATRAGDLELVTTGSGLLVNALLTVNGTDLTVSSASNMYIGALREAGDNRRVESEGNHFPFSGNIAGAESTDRGTIVGVPIQFINTPAEINLVARSTFNATDVRSTEAGKDFEATGLVVFTDPVEFKSIDARGTKGIWLQTHPVNPDGTGGTVTANISTNGGNLTLVAEDRDVRTVNRVPENGNQATGETFFFPLTPGEAISSFASLEAKGGAVNIQSLNGDVMLGTVQADQGINIQASGTIFFDGTIDGKGTANVTLTADQVATGIIGTLGTALKVGGGTGLLINNAVDVNLNIGTSVSVAGGPITFGGDDPTNPNITGKVTFTRTGTIPIIVSTQENDLRISTVLDNASAINLGDANLQAPVIELTAKGQSGAIQTTGIFTLQGSTKRLTLTQGGALNFGTGTGEINPATQIPGSTNVELIATSLNNTVTFNSAASWKKLTATANNDLTVATGANQTTGFGDLKLTSNNGSIISSAALDASSLLTLSATTGNITAANLSGNGIVVQASSSTGTITLNTSTVDGRAVGDVTFTGFRLTGNSGLTMNNVKNVTFNINDTITINSGNFSINNAIGTITATMPAATTVSGGDLIWSSASNTAGAINFGGNNLSANNITLSVTGGTNATIINTDGTLGGPVGQPVNISISQGQNLIIGNDSNALTTTDLDDFQSTSFINLTATSTNGTVSVGIPSGGGTFTWNSLTLNGSSGVTVIANQTTDDTTNGGITLKATGTNSVIQINADLTSAQDITLQATSTGGNIQQTAGNLKTGIGRTLSITQNAALTIGAGGIANISNTPDSNLVAESTANLLTLNNSSVFNSITGIGNTGLTASTNLETDIGAISLSVTGGSIDITVKNLTVQNLSGGGTAITVTPTRNLIFAAGATEVAGGTGAIVLGETGGLDGTIDASLATGLNIRNASNVTFVNTGNVTVNGGAFTINDTITGNIVATAPPQVIVQGSNNLTWVAGGTITAKDITDSAGNVSLTATGTSGAISTGNITSPGVTLNTSGTITLSAPGTNTTTINGGATGAVTLTGANLNATTNGLDIQNISSADLNISGTLTIDGGSFIINNGISGNIDAFGVGAIQMTGRTLDWRNTAGNIVFNNANISNALSIRMEAPAGSISVAGTTGSLSVNGDGGDITLLQSGTLTLGTGGLIFGGTTGFIDLNATSNAGTVVLASDQALHSLTAVGQTGVTISGNQSTDNAAISLTATTGNISLGTSNLTALTDIILNAPAGAITGTGNVDFVNTGGNHGFTLTQSGALIVGTGGLNLPTPATVNLNLTSTANTITFASAFTWNTLVAQAGVIDVNANQSTDNGALTLTSTTGNIDSTGFSLSAANGALTLTTTAASTDILTGTLSGLGVTVTPMRNLTLGSSVDGLGGAVLLGESQGAVDGTLTATSGLTIQNASNVTLQNSGAITVTGGNFNVTATGIINATAAPTTTVTGADLIWTSSNNAASSINFGSNNLSANNLTLTTSGANGTILNTDGTLTATATTNPTLTLSQGAALTIGAGAGSVADEIQNRSAVQLIANSTSNQVTFSSDLGTFGGLTATGNTGIQITSAIANLATGATVLTATTGNVDTNGNNLVSTGALTLGATAGTVNANSLTAAGVTVTAGTTITLASTIDAQTAGVTLTAPTLNAITNGLDIQDSNSVDLNISGTLNVNNGNFTINNAVTGTVDATGTGIINVQGANTLTWETSGSGGINYGAADINASSISMTTTNATATIQQTTNGSLAVNADGGNITLIQNPSLTVGTGGILFVFGGTTTFIDLDARSSTGSVNLASAQSLNSLTVLGQTGVTISGAQTTDNGVINVTATTGDINAGTNALNATGGSLTLITTEAGKTITSGNLSGVGITANATTGTIQLSSTIDGKNGAINLTGTTLNATTNGLTVQNSTQVTLTDFTALNVDGGAFTTTSTTNIDASGATINVLNGNNLAFTASTISSGGITTTGAGNITFISPAGQDLNVTVSGNISAGGNLNLTAVNGQNLTGLNVTGAFIAGTGGSGVVNIGTDGQGNNTLNIITNGVTIGNTTTPSQGNINIGNTGTIQVNAGNFTIQTTGIIDDINAGDIQLPAGGGDLSWTSTAANGGGGFAIRINGDITNANNIILSAANGSINTPGNTLTVNNNGSVNLTQSGALTLGNTGFQIAGTNVSVSATSSTNDVTLAPFPLGTTLQSISLSAPMGSINGTGNLAVNTNGSVSLTQSGGLTLGASGLQIAGTGIGLSVTSTTSNVTLDNFTFTDASSITLSAANGTISTINGVATLGVNAVGNISLTQSGTLNIGDTNNIQLGGVQTNINLIANAASVNFTRNFSLNSVNATATTGEITTNGMSLTTTGALSLNAATNVRAGDLQGSGVSVTAGATSDIFLSSNVNGLGQGVTFAGRNLNATTDGLVISNASNVTFNNTGAITTGGAGGFSISANVTGAITATAPSQIDVQGAGNNLNWTSTGNIDASTTNITSAGGVTLSTNGNLTAGSLTGVGVTANATTITLASTIDAQTQGVSLTATTLNATTNGLDIQDSNLVDLNIGTLNVGGTAGFTINNAITGNIDIAGTGAVNVQGTNQPLTWQTTGDIIATGNGAVSVSGALSLNAGGAGGINYDGRSLTADSINLTATQAASQIQQSANGSLAVNANGGDVTLSQGSSLTIGTLGANDVRLTGNVNFIDLTATSTAGGVTFSSAQTLNSLNATGMGNVLLSQAQTTDSGSLQLTSQTGTVTTPSLTAPTNLSLSGAQGILSSVPGTGTLESVGADLTLNSGTGKVQGFSSLKASGLVNIIGDVENVNGALVIDAGDRFQIASTLSSGQDLTLKATNSISAVTAGSQVISNAGNISLIAPTIQGFERVQANQNLTLQGNFNNVGDTRFIAKNGVLTLVGQFNISGTLFLDSPILNTNTATFAQGLNLVFVQQNTSVGEELNTQREQPIQPVIPVRPIRLERPFEPVQSRTADLFEKLFGLQLPVSPEMPEVATTPSPALDLVSGIQIGQLPTLQKSLKRLYRLNIFLMNPTKLNALADRIESRPARFNSLISGNDWFRDAWQFLQLSRSVLSETQQDPDLAGEIFLEKYVSHLETTHPKTYSELQKFSQKRKGIITN